MNTGEDLISNVEEQLKEFLQIQTKKEREMNRSEAGAKVANVYPIVISTEKKSRQNVWGEG